MERGGRGFSMVGHVTYSRAHPSRWAGTHGLARLTVDDDGVVIEPLPPWSLLRYPTVRIPLASITRADTLPFGGFRFTVPSAPELDGTRFRGIVPGDDRLTTLGHELARNGLSGEPVPFTKSWREELGNQAVAQRPGFIWRDRGRLAYVESAAVLAIGVGIAYWQGFSPWLMLLLAVPYTMWALFGHRLRRR